MNWATSKRENNVVFSRVLEASLRTTDLTASQETDRREQKNHCVFTLRCLIILIGF